jgi:hypothetical protein
MRWPRPTVEDTIDREKRGHDLNYVGTGLIRAATPHVYLSTVIDETPCDIAYAFSWPLAMTKRG